MERLWRKSEKKNRWKLKMELFYFSFDWNICVLHVLREIYYIFFSYFDWMEKSGKEDKMPITFTIIVF